MSSRPTGHRRHPRLAASLIALMPGVVRGQDALPQGTPAVASPANATAQNNDPAGIADIVVTAERRETSVQKTPLTIQVLSGAQLVEAGINDTADLQKLTSGVQIGKSGASTQIFIRGVGSFAASPLSTPGVAFNVDGVYVGRPDGTSGNFYDLSRVEVLKGPQGTLYGRNATGGSINLITNAPLLDQNSIEGSIEGGNYSYVHATGAINVAIGETAALRGSFNIINRDGFISDGTNDDKEQAGRLRFKWKPTSTITLLLNGDYSHLGGKGGDYVYLPLRPGASPYEAVTTPAANAYLRTFGPASALIDPSLPDNFQDTTLYNISAQLDAQLPFATLTVLPAFRYVDSNYLTHFTTELTNHSVDRQRSVEVRLGNSSPRLTWVVGGYFFNEDAPNSVQLTRTSQFLQNYIIENSPSTTSYAAFGQATYEIVDRLRLIGGARYTNEQKSFNGSLTNRATTPFVVAETFGGQRTFNNVSYKAGAEFDITSQKLVFATYSTGFKSGGFSQNVAPNTYDPEKLRAAEIGFRNRFLDNRLQLNFGVFHWKYSGIQDSRPAFDNLGNLNLITFNSGDATIYGGTTDIVVKPSSADTFSLSSEYAHSRYDQFAYLTPAPFFNPKGTGCAVSGPYLPGQTLPVAAGGKLVSPRPIPEYLSNCAGFPVARTPKFSGTMAYSHVVTLPSAATIAFDANLTFASARYLTIDFTQTEYDRAYALLNANVTYTSANGRLSVALFGRNLTDTVYYTGGLQSPLVPPLLAANIGSPRTYGVRVGFRFGS